MLWSAVWDIVGSVYEWNNHKSKEFALFAEKSFFTDDTVLSFATAKALMDGSDFAGAYRDFALRYPGRGYGPMFMSWAMSKSDPPRSAYNYGQPSFWNGSAMRVGPVGWAFDTFDRTIEVARLTALPTHGHDEGIKGAVAVAGAVFLARTGVSKDEIRNRLTDVCRYDFSCVPDAIRETYHFDTTCQGSVPQALAAFFESDSFEDAIRNAISIWGDSDTIACITGSVAEAYYGIPEDIADEALRRLPEEFLTILRNFCETFPEYGRRRAWAS